MLRETIFRIKLADSRQSQAEETFHSIFFARGAGNGTCQGAPIVNDSTCASKLRVACRPDSVYQTGATMYGLSSYFTPSDMPQALANFLLIRGEVSPVCMLRCVAAAPHTLCTLCALIAVCCCSQYAWLGYSWRPCTSGGENSTHSCAGGHGFVQPDGSVLCSWFSRNQSLLFDTDYGEPLGLCRETRPPSFSGGTYLNGSGVFVREWTHATVETDCNTWESTITMK